MTTAYILNTFKSTCFLFATVPIRKSKSHTWLLPCSVANIDPNCIVSMAFLTHVERCMLFFFFFKYSSDVGGF